MPAFFVCKWGDCTQGCVYFVYLYTLGAKKEAPTLARGHFSGMAKKRTEQNRPSNPP